MPNVNLAPYDAQQAAINRRRQLAQALQQQSLEPLEMPNVAGAQISPLQGYAKLAQALFAGLQNRKLDKQQSALDTQMQTSRDEKMKALAQALGVDPTALDSEFGGAIVNDVLATKRQKAGNEADLARALATKPIDPLSAEGVAAQQTLHPPQPRNIDPLSPEGIAAQLQIHPPQAPTPPAPRNIDPLSPEGIAAQLQLANEKPVKPPTDERLVQIMGPMGTPIWVRESQAVGKPAAQAARAVTGAERQSLAYYNRAKEADETLTTPAANGGDSLEDRIAKSGLGGQVRGQYAPNFMQSEDQQAYRQAQRAFTEARLRKESGAAIPTQEYENDAKIYFVRPGDDLKTIEQKRKARQTVLNGLKFSSGKAYEEFYGDSGPQSPGGGADPLGLFNK